MKKDYNQKKKPRREESKGRATTSGEKEKHDARVLHHIVRSKMEELLQLVIFIQ